MSNPAEAERRALLHYIVAARKAIADLRPAQMRLQSLPTAMSQIGLIVETTETAANQIMQAVDEIMNARVDISPTAYRTFVDEKCLIVLEACAFQDITGQRITKVVETLLMLEDKLAALSDLLDEEVEPQTADAQESDAVLLNGPAMPGEGVDQDEIDKLFA